ncbi:ferredoxin--NADP reductase [Hymenobacter sp. DG25A]|uniref:ferredoxin--NADP reductase n=1 Tax=Hymenobacter sp. DG25A TaxID=1385663 RepID=UPI0006BC21CE|nr:ferredoxin--NADP reductase [Hymenobacter sp. DG25A]ALD22468.1 hypothetical protein AM218_16230 [Hymenobacter sp. DG25A]
MTSADQLLTIWAIRQETADVKTFVLEVPAGTVLPYQAGQYLTLVHQVYGREVRRSYSISSAPVLHEPLSITVKRVENGLISRRLIDHAQPGDTLSTIGAAGFFTLPPDIEDFQQLVLVAAGSGITPIFALLKTVLHAHPHLRVLLLYSNRTPESTIFREPLLALARLFPERLHLEMLYSNNPDLARARLYKELLEELVRRYTTAPPEDTLAYLCGPLNFMRMATYGLHETGLPLSHIRREQFNPDAATVPHSVPPDTDAHRVLLRFRGQEHHLLVQYPHTILQAARQQGLLLPYSCEAGQCGQCAAHCTAGQVWMAVNEVLTDRETARGLVLTCTGYPIGSTEVRLEM